MKFLKNHYLKGNFSIIIDIGCYYISVFCILPGIDIPDEAEEINDYINEIDQTLMIKSDES